MTTTAALFDMDGVLVDSAPLHVRAYEQVFRDAGIEFSAAGRDAVRRGKPRSEVIEIAVPGVGTAIKQALFDAKPNAVAKLLRTVPNRDALIARVDDRIKGSSTEYQKRLKRKKNLTDMYAWLHYWAQLAVYNQNKK